MMREVQGYFDKLYFSESVLGEVHLAGQRLSVPVRSLFLLAGHPLETTGYGPYEGELVFDGVASSRRTITEYVGDAREPTGFNPPRDVVDEILSGDTQTEGLQEFGFEGYQESPSAWIDNWVIQAKLFVLKVKASPHLPPADSDQVFIPKVDASWVIK